MSMSIILNTNLPAYMQMNLYELFRTGLFHRTKSSICCVWFFLWKQKEGKVTLEQVGAKGFAEVNLPLFVLNLQ